MSLHSMKQVAASLHVFHICTRVLDKPKVGGTKHHTLNDYNQIDLCHVKCKTVNQIEYIYNGAINGTCDVSKP